MIYNEYGVIDWGIARDFEDKIETAIDAAMKEKDLSDLTPPELYRLAQLCSQIAEGHLLDKAIRKQYSMRKGAALPQKLGA